MFYPAAEIALASLGENRCCYHGVAPGAGVVCRRLRDGSPEFEIWENDTKVATGNWDQLFAKEAV